MKRPVEFTKRMQDMLKEEYELFDKSYLEESKMGLRVNILKKRLDFDLLKEFVTDPIEWVKEGYYVNPEKRPGKHPLHEAGAYYLQEPSAMAVGEYMEARPGDLILDLCAAPGGKTTHMASRMNNEGLLIANEIHPTRAKILSENVERFGLTNTVVTNESPDHLADRYMEFFDKILVDAPCSGEGMFRKDPEAMNHWSIDNVELCARRQKDILDCAYRMLKSGGRLVYSTCTFAPEENEANVLWLLRTYPDLECEKVQKHPQMSWAIPEWAGLKPEDSEYKKVARAIRLWPHRLSGEGHFIAVFTKKSQEISEEEDKSESSLNYSTNQKLDLTDEKISKRKKKSKKSAKKEELSDTKSIFEEFIKTTLKVPINGELLDQIEFGDHLYQYPITAGPLDRMKVLRPGIHLGTFKKQRFEPSHALALALDLDQVRQVHHVEIEEAVSYLKGMTLNVDPSFKGWVLVAIEDWGLGWGKAVNGILKNHYPKGLRWY